MNAKRFFIILTIIALLLTACASAATPIIEEMVAHEAEAPAEAAPDLKPQPAGPAEPPADSGDSPDPSQGCESFFLAGCQISPA